MSSASFYINDSSYKSVSSGANQIASAVGYSAESPSSTSTNWYSSSSTALDAGYAQYTFDLSSIPSTATNIQVACKVAGKAESSTYSHQKGGRYSVWGLCCNGTSKGSQVYTTSTSRTTITFTDTGSWTRTELDGLQLRHYVGNYGGTTNGATLTITYVDVTYKVTVTVKNDNVTVDKNGEYDVSEGDSFVISSTSGVISKITDNNIDVSNLLQQKEATSGDSGTLTKNPSEYTTSGTISGTNYRNAIGKGSSNTASGNDYSNGGSSSTATITYSFDFSEIPENAIIDSVSVLVGGHIESTSNSSRKAQCQLYSGSTAKGSSQSFTTTSKQVLTMDTGTWTRAELQNATLQFTIGYYGGLINGVDFTVNYSLPSQGEDYYYTYAIDSVTEDHIIIINDNMDAGTPLRVKLNGSYKKVLKILQKQNGSYVEISIDNLSTMNNFKYIT